MPTAAKLAAAIAFALIGLLIAEFYLRALPEGAVMPWIRLVTVLVGIICGWRILGPLAGRRQGRVDAMGTGIRVALTIVFWVLVIYAIREMLNRSTKGIYKSPLDALLGGFELWLKFAQPLLAPEVIASILLGGIIGGAVAHWAGQRWN
jgi:hypothetical protein